MKKIRDHSDDDDYEVDDPDDPEVEASEEEWTPEGESEVKIRASLSKRLIETFDDDELLAPYRPNDKRVVFTRCFSPSVRVSNVADPRAAKSVRRIFGHAS